jgi:MFS family permease
MVPQRRRLTLALTTAVFAVVCASRVVVFPASIWEQDEAYFAAAVVAIDITDSAPHPPFFPLWIGVGKALHQLGLEPAASLQVASACLGSLMFLPLVALWSRLMKPSLAIAAAALGLAVPGVWLLSGRAFSGTPATAMLVAALACWTRPDPGRRWLAAGSLAAGFAMLTRPHFGLVVAAVILAMLAGPARRHWPALVAPTAVVTVAGAAVFVIAAGGPAAVWAAVPRHAALHFGALPEASHGLLDSGLSRCLGHPLAAVAWCALAAVGGWLALRSTTDRAAALPVVAGLASSVVLVFGLSNPAHPRYAVPLVVLSSGFVVLGLRRLLSERWTPAVVAAALAAAAAQVLPAAPGYRRQPSPPLAALDYADHSAVQRGGVVVSDRTLHSFVIYREAVGRSAAPAIFDHVLDLGASPPPPASRTVFVFDDGHAGLLVASERRRTFSCTEEVLRRLAQDRFLDVTVADGAELTNRSGSDGPFVILD